MEDFNKIKEKIKSQLDSANYAGDLSDLGNEIGIVLGEYLITNNELNDFLSGLNHGISLGNGTHG